MDRLKLAPLAFIFICCIIQLNAQKYSHGDWTFHDHLLHPLQKVQIEHFQKPPYTGLLFP